jgi:hypothetical protein
MRKAIDRLFLTRLLPITGLSLALMSANSVGVRADTVTGASGAPGTDCDLIADPSCYSVGGDGESVTALGNPAYAAGGNGGDAGAGVYGNGGNGGSATAVATDSSASGDVTVSAGASGGTGGYGYATTDYYLYGNGGRGGSALAEATGSSGSGNVTVSASATGGNGGFWYGLGGDASAGSTATTGSPGGALSSATATGGADSFPLEPFHGVANATSNAEADFGGMSVKSTVVASSPASYLTSTASASAFSIALPDKADARALIGGATNVADALLDPGATVFGIAVLGGEEVVSASATFDFTYRGDLLLGLMDDDKVIALGSSLGPNIDLTVYGPGAFVLGGVVPETSTWAMMLLGFAGLGFTGWRAQRRSAVV